MRALLALVFLVGCTPSHPTAGGLVVEYEPGAKRLSKAKLQEMDARYADTLQCLQDGGAPIEVTSKPIVRIRGECDRLPDGTRGRYSIGWIKVPPSLGAAAHEFTHRATGDTGHGKESWPYKCGDKIDGKYRRLYPPDCPQDRSDAPFEWRGVSCSEASP